MKVVRWIAAAFALAGLGLLAGSVVSWRNTQDFLEQSASAQGIVTEVDRRHTSDRRGRSSTYYAYKFRFTPAIGQPLESFAGEGSSSPEYQVGDEVTIRYRRSDPTEVQIDDFQFIWFRFSALLVLGLAALVMGAGNIWLSFGRGDTRQREGNLREFFAAWRQGKAGRNSRYRVLLVALTFALPPIIAGLALFIVFGHVVVQVIVFAMLAWIVVGIVRKK